MAYIVIEASVATHRKFLAAGPAASWLWICGLSYCQNALTDGFIPQSALRFLGVDAAAKLAPKLVNAGLWDEAPEGWQMHDYLDHNKSAEEVRGLMRRRASAGKEGGRPRKHPHLPETPGVYFIHADGLVKIGCTDNLRQRAASFTARAGVSILMWRETAADESLGLEQELHQRFADLRKRGEWFDPSGKLLRFLKENPQGFSTHNYPENPLLSGTTSPTGTSDRPTSPRVTARASAERFSAFWANYPRKVGKGDAERKFQALNLDDATFAAILSALAWQSQQPQWTREHGKYIPHPATWLQQRRWEDEPFHAMPDDPADLLSANDAAWAQADAVAGGKAR